MTNYIDEMMKTAGVELTISYFVAVNPQSKISPAKSVTEKRRFTAEKQLEIIKLVGKIDGVVYTFDFDGDWHIIIKNINIFNKDFTQALAQLVTELMKAGELDKKKVKEILEG